MLEYSLNGRVIKIDPKELSVIHTGEVFAPLDDRLGDFIHGLNRSTNETNSPRGRQIQKDERKAFIQADQKAAERAAAPPIEPQRLTDNKGTDHRAASGGRSTENRMRVWTCGRPLRRDNHRTRCAATTWTAAAVYAGTTTATRCAATTWTAAAGWYAGQPRNPLRRDNLDSSSRLVRWDNHRNPLRRDNLDSSSRLDAGTTTATRCGRFCPDRVEADGGIRVQDE